MPCYTKILCRCAKNDDRIQSLYELYKCLATALGINITGMDVVVPSQILGAFLVIFVYCFVPHPITPPTMWQMFQVLLVCFDHMHI
jgi:hypothetical protein